MKKISLSQAIEENLRKWKKDLESINSDILVHLDSSLYNTDNNKQKGIDITIVPLISQGGLSSGGKNTAYQMLWQIQVSVSGEKKSKTEWIPGVKGFSSYSNMEQAIIPIKIYEYFESQINHLHFSIGKIGPQTVINSNNRNRTLIRFTLEGELMLLMI